MLNVAIIGGGLTVSTTDLTTELALFVAVRVYVVVTPGVTETLPLAGTVPMP